MNETLLRYWWMLALCGGIAVAFGLCALLLPGITLFAFIALFAAYAMFGGAVWAFGAIHIRKQHDS